MSLRSSREGVAIWRKVVIKHPGTLATATISPFARWIRLESGRDLSTRTCTVGSCRKFFHRDCSPFGRRTSRYNHKRHCRAPSAFILGSRGRARPQSFATSQMTRCAHSGGGPPRLYGRVRWLHPASRLAGHSYLPVCVADLINKVSPLVVAIDASEWGSRFHVQLEFVISKLVTNFFQGVKTGGRLHPRQQRSDRRNAQRFHIIFLLVG